MATEEESLLVHFPNEVLLHIFKFLPSPKDLGNCCQVCVTWYCVVSDPEAWQLTYKNWFGNDLLPAKSTVWKDRVSWAHFICKSATKDISSPSQLAEGQWAPFFNNVCAGQAYGTSLVLCLDSIPSTLTEHFDISQVAQIISASRLAGHTRLLMKLTDGRFVFALGEPRENCLMFGSSLEVLIRYGMSYEDRLPMGIMLPEDEVWLRNAKKYEGVQALENLREIFNKRRRNK
jgi:hypothetical protein